MYPASDKGLNKETKDAVYFFTTAFYPLDNFSAHAVSIWEQDFPTAEHAYQWKKFSAGQPTIADQILVARSPQAVKEIADKNKDKQPTNWSDEKVSVMEEILHAKAEQHSDVQAVLIKTGTKRIIENSPVDSFWGTGSNGEGKNVVGEIWMKVRDSL